MELPNDDSPAYCIDVFFDILDDDICLWTIYRFKTQQIAEEFIEQVPFVCSDIQYTTTVRTDDGHCDNCPYRPTFHTLEDALADARDFYSHGNNQENYKYAGRVFERDLSDLEMQYYKNLIKKLKKENEELKVRVKELEGSVD